MRMRVMLVEDDAKVARFVARAFEEERWVVDRVTSGPTAVEQCEIGYDAVVLDWMLPELDGLSVVRTLRRRGLETPVLMLTARGSVKERILGLEAGADDYLAKPFDLGELIARMRALVRRATGERSILEVGPLRIDRRTREVTLAHRPPDRTARELGVLTLLAERAGRTVTKTEFLASLWSLSFDPTSNVVEVQVKNLRAKLGARASLIDTVRGVGYRLVTSSSDSRP